MNALSKRIAVALSLVLTLDACDRPHASPPPAQHIDPSVPTTRIVYLPTVTVQLKGRPFVIELATTEAQQQTGLMYRPSMPADHAMIFVFPQSQQLGFWMKNTLIPLDIAFLDDAGVVLNVAQMYPLSERSVPSAGEAKYAIELNLGIAEKIGLVAGDHVDLPASLK